MDPRSSGNVSHGFSPITPHHSYQKIIDLHNRIMGRMHPSIKAPRYLEKYIKPPISPISSVSVKNSSQKLKSTIAIQDVCRSMNVSDVNLKTHHWPLQETHPMERRAGDLTNIANFTSIDINLPVNRGLVVSSRNSWPTQHNWSERRNDPRSLESNSHTHENNMFAPDALEDFSNNGGPSEGFGTNRSYQRDTGMGSRTIREPKLFPVEPKIKLEEPSNQSKKRPRTTVLLELPFTRKRTKKEIKEERKNKSRLKELSKISFRDMPSKNNSHSTQDDSMPFMRYSSQSAFQSCSHRPLTSYASTQSVKPWNDALSNQENLPCGPRASHSVQLSPRLKHTVKLPPHDSRTSAPLHSEDPSKTSRAGRPSTHTVDPKLQYGKTNSNVRRFQSQSRSKSTDPELSTSRSQFRLPHRTKPADEVQPTTSSQEIARAQPRPKAKSRSGYRPRPGAKDLATSQPGPKSPQRKQPQLGSQPKPGPPQQPRAQMTEKQYKIRNRFQKPHNGQETKNNTKKQPR